MAIDLPPEETPGLSEPAYPAGTAGPVRLTAPVSGRGSRPRVARLCVLALLAQGAPALVSDSTLLTVDLGCIYAVAAIGLNVIFGLGGLISVGQAAMMAVGGYTLMLLFGHGVGVVVGLLAAATTGASASVLMVILGARAKTHYFILVSLALAEVIVLVATNATGLTGGSNGIALAGTPTLFGLDLTTTTGFFRFAVVLLVVIWYLADALRASRSGLALSALTMNEHIALAAGVGARTSRGLAAAVGGMFGGIAGAMLALVDGYIGPQNFDLVTAVLLLLIVVVAGRARNGSVVLAALILTFLSQGFLTLQAVGELVYGVGLIVLIVFAPEGLSGAAEFGRQAFRRVWQRFDHRGRKQAS